MFIIDYYMTMLIFQSNKQYTQYTTATDWSRFSIQNSCHA
jgi:hypothetical protein